jgi:hypothetical protein
MRVEKFAALSHLEISSVHHATNFIDDALSRSKLSRWVTLRPAFLSAVSILATSDLISGLPQRVTQELPSLEIGQLAQSSLCIATSMIWPRWLDSQPAHGWLPQNVECAAHDLRSN